VILHSVQTINMHTRK